MAGSTVSILTVPSLRDLRVGRYKKHHGNGKIRALRICKEIVMVLTFLFATEEYRYVVVLNCLTSKTKVCFEGLKLQSSIM